MERAHGGDEDGKGGECSKLHDQGVRGGGWCLGEREVRRKQGRRRYLYETGEKPTTFFSPITRGMTCLGRGLTPFPA